MWRVSLTFSPDNLHSETRGNLHWRVYGRSPGSPIPPLPPNPWLLKPNGREEPRYFVLPRELKSSILSSTPTPLPPSTYLNVSISHCSYATSSWWQDTSIPNKTKAYETLTIPSVINNFFLTHWQSTRFLKSGSWLDSDGKDANRSTTLREAAPDFTSGWVFLVQKPKYNEKIKKGRSFSVNVVCDSFGNFSTNFF